MAEFIVRRYKVAGLQVVRVVARKRMLPRVVILAFIVTGDKMVYPLLHAMNWLPLVPVLPRVEMGHVLALQELREHVLRRVPQKGYLQLGAVRERALHIPLKRDPLRDILGCVQQERRASRLWNVYKAEVGSTWKGIGSLLGRSWNCAEFHGLVRAAQRLPVKGSMCATGQPYRQ